MKPLALTAVLLALVALFLLAALVQAPAIERDVAGRANAELASRGFPWASAGADGLDLTVRGGAPDAIAQGRALETARGVPGVRSVTDETAVLPAPGDPIAICQNRVRALLDEGMIQFRSASAEIERGSDSILDRIVEILESCPEAVVQVGGHTDNVGNAENNRKLSAARAESVRAYLESKGIPAGRLKAVGFGQDHPIASNDTEAGRRQNRRIEFILWRGEP